ncbi:hypothetical protein [Rhizobium sp. RU36D]|uniref:hypothetical protein n=1 Tax=Rhizobium sp. RU36D TaxID=1907415 RepID=UPI0009D8F72A|nr:hypothetical protein [Rhizobium sp. RU36D]SMC73199.1 hypothetical protein SAMN05880593_105212 [Rhizobium sp. RU36D]
MKTVIALLALMLPIAGCTTGYGTSVGALEPIPGSITYGGQPASRLTKAPIGSQVPHEFRDRQGRRVMETYVIQPDRSLLLVSRRTCDSPFCDD